MAPLLPSESRSYTLTLPEEVDDDRNNLKLRTGSALTYTRSSVVVHGGLTVGLSLKQITMPEIKKQLNAIQATNISQLVSNQFFYLNIANRKWRRLELDLNQLMPKARFFHSLAFHGNSIYLFGGLTIDEDAEELIPANDLWEFNLDSNEWTCLDDGYITGTVARFDHSMLVSQYTSPTDGKEHLALVIAGGKGERNEELVPVIIYDLERKRFIPTTIMELILNEKSSSRNVSASSAVDPKSKESESTKYTLRLVSESNFIIPGSTNANDTDSENVLYILDPLDDHQDMLSPIVNPIIALPLVPRAAGLRLPLSEVMKKKSCSVIPNTLEYPSGGIFGPNIIVSGYNRKSREYQLYLFNKPSQKWTRLNIDSSKRAKELYLWTSFTWPSHHKVVILGSSAKPADAEYNTIQTFDLLILVGLPITNVFHAFSEDSTNIYYSKGSRSTSMKPSSSFEEYSKYISPSTKISSIRSVFPNYAMTLGRNAFERYGPSLSDFEFVTADGDKVNIPVMLLRKRWGRCFDMLLAKGYARAVHNLENKKEEESEKEDEDNSDNSDTHSIRSNSTSKKSVIMMNKSNAVHTEPAPQFRLPFQDGQAPTSAATPITFPPSSSGGPTSRKASIISSGNLSITSTSTSGDGAGGQQDIEFDLVPTQLPFPNEPLPHLDSKAPLKSINARDFRDSPRGSISGSSMTGLNPTSVNKLKDLRTSFTFKKRGISRSSSLPSSAQDEMSGTESGSNLDSIAHDVEECTATLLEPLLIPRCLYLPFPTVTVQAFAEFLFTGQLGDKWLLTPTTSDNFLIAKFYELPLLYDLISEVLFAIIGKKEDSLIKEYGKLSKECDQKVRAIFKNHEYAIQQFYKEHPHINASFKDIEDLFNTVDDGYMNLSLLRKASKASSGSTSTPRSGKYSVDSTNRVSMKSPVRTGKSSLSKQVCLEGTGDNEDEYNEFEDDADIDEDIHPRQLTTKNAASSTEKPLKPSFFKTDSLNSSKPKKHSVEINDPLDPIAPLKPVEPKRFASSDIKFESKYDSSEIDTDDKKAVEEARVIDGRKKQIKRIYLEDEDPLSSSSIGTTAESEFSDSIDPLQKTTHVDPRTSGISAVDFQVPEGRFELAKDKILKDSTSSSSDKYKESTSDSDEMGVGLGLVNLKLDMSDKTYINIKSDSKPEEQELPTLESLASPNSPPAPIHLLQVVYEVAALACDMKLLLRTMNVLEMSKTFEAKKTELMTEIEDFEIQYKAKDSATSNMVNSNNSFESKPDKNEITTAPVQGFHPTTSYSMNRSQTEDFSQQATKQKQSKASFESHREEHDNTDVSLRSFSIRSTFSNFNPIKSSSSNVVLPKANTKEPIEATPTPRHSILNPFSRKKTGDESSKRGLLSSLISKSSQPKKS